MMKYLGYILRQTGRNLLQTWTTQLMSMLAVSMSVLIFAFFFLIYANMMSASRQLGDELRLTVYLEEDLTPELRKKLEERISTFITVERITYISRAEAFARLQRRLGDQQDILTDLTPAFLPPSIEIFPQKDLASLAKIKELTSFLSTFPSVAKVQDGHEWIERFNYFVQLIRIIVLLSGGLLVLTSIFMVSYTLRLAIYRRQAEFEILRLLGASNASVRGPFFLEGVLQGLLGSTIGLGCLYVLFAWVKERLNGPGLLHLLELSFFSASFAALLIAASIFLCVGGSLISMRKFLRV